MEIVSKKEVSVGHPKNKLTEISEMTITFTNKDLWNLNMCIVDPDTFGAPASPEELMFFDELQALLDAALD